MSSIAEGPVLVSSALDVELSSKPILSDISFEVKSGDRIAIVGKSGAGKSTLLGALVGDPTASNGSVSLFGFDIAQLSKTKLRALRRGTAHISQGFDLVDDFSAIENVLIGDFARYRFPRLWQWSYSKYSIEAAQDLLKRMNLQDQTNQRVGTMSGGERQRVAIARAMISKPKILFADEPISALDVDSSSLIMADLKLASESGAAVIAAMHQIPQALDWATWVIVLAGGQIVSQGPSASFSEADLEELIAKS